MDTLTIFSVVAFAALIHASFQLGVSVVTMLTGHATGKRIAPNKTLRLVGAFFGGTVVATGLVLFTLLYFADRGIVWQSPASMWSVVCAALVAVGLGVWVFYYRRGTGTPLWIPRAFARFLTTRVRTTTLSVEAFSLGLTTVIAELPFMAAPLVASALALSYLPANLQLLGALGYITIASLGMIIVTVLIGSGHNLSHIQRWRERNKRFLQFAAGSGLIILGLYLYANQIVASSVGGIL